MGAASSKTSVAPILPGTTLSSSQIAEAVKALGPPYIPYAEKLEENGMDGAFLEAITAADLSGLLADIGVTSSFHQKKLEIVFNSFKSGGIIESVEKPNDKPSQILKAFASFLSHYKLECGTEARLVQLQLRPIIEKNPFEGSSHEVFLDSDDLSDLRNLLQHVIQTKVLVLLQTKGVLTRPWVIMELYTAITNEVPIVALNVKNASPYDYAEAMNFLMFFDQEIDIANPGAAHLLIDMGIDPVDVAYRLSDCLPNIISTDFNPNASEKVIQASLEDLADSMRKVVPIAPSVTKEEWLEKRRAFQPNSLLRKAHGASEGAAATSSVAGVTSANTALAEIPHTVPELPGAYLVRLEDISNLKKALKDGSGSTSVTAKKSQKKQTKVGAHGMVSIPVH